MELEIRKFPFQRLEHRSKQNRRQSDRKIDRGDLDDAIEIHVTGQYSPDLQEIDKHYKPNGIGLI